MLNTICIVGGLGNMGSKHFNKLKSKSKKKEIWRNREGVEYTADSNHMYGVFYEDTYIGTSETEFQGLDVSDIGCEKDLSKYNSLIIATPSDTHYEIAKAAIERGQNVLLEKPVTLSYKEAQTLYRLAKEYNVVYMSGHTMRYNPEFRKLISELYHTPHLHFELHVLHDNVVENAVFDLMIHGFELAFNLGQREMNREFQLLGCETQDSWVTAEVIIGSKICTFEVSYKSDRDIRRLHAWDPQFVVDFHASDGETSDALDNLHEHFIRACDTGAWIDQAEHATASVQLAEKIQNKLFDK